MTDADLALVREAFTAFLGDPDIIVQTDQSTVVAAYWHLQTLVVLEASGVLKVIPSTALGCVQSEPSDMPSDSPGAEQWLSLSRRLQ